MSNQTLWYCAPAACWTEALPLGNGRLGAMVFGGTDQERIALNEDTLWTGHPKSFSRPGAADAFYRARELVRAGEILQAEALLKRDFLSDESESYMPLGDLNLQFGHANPTSYRRSLSLEDAACHVEYASGEVLYRRRAYVSLPDAVLVVEIDSSVPGTLSFTARLSSPLQSASRTEGNVLILSGRCPEAAPQEEYDAPPILTGEGGIGFCAVLSATTDGTLCADGGEMRVVGASHATLLLSARSNFAGYAVSPSQSPIDARSLAMADIAQGTAQLAHLYSRHLAAYQPMWNRTCLNLAGPSRDELPTDERLQAFQRDPSDSGLPALLFSYGRYLLLSGSQPGTQPMNLQGIWNESTSPAWRCNYTTNINTQMNYWPALCTNLEETLEPLTQMLRELSVQGRQTAQEYYGAPGFVCHHNTDLWRHTRPTGMHRPDSVTSGFWPMASGWLCSHLYDRWRTCMDDRFLAETAYPISREACRFYLSLLTQEDGFLLFCPANSPENRYRLGDATASLAKTTEMTNAILRELFSHTEAMARQLPGEEAFADRLREAAAQLRPIQTTQDGRIREWWDDEEDAEATHRHTSHLYGLFPGRQITPDNTPELAQACRRTLLRRTDDGTGWSLGWKICLWARLGDGDHALRLLVRQLRPVSAQTIDYHFGGGTYPNLLDAHPPFQIDGNLGACAGIAEMLLQSREDEILLLPALPKAWPEGEVRGLRAFGGLTVDMRWKNGCLKQLCVRADRDCDARLRIGSSRLALHLTSGQEWRESL